MKKVIIIGAGPAGLMAAIVASSQGAQVVIYEKNKIPGKKLLLTGNGRCNVTNKANTQAFLNQIVTNPRFLYSSLAAFNSADLINFLHSQGVETKEEDQGRMFPASDDAKDILRCLLNVCQKQQVTIKVNAPVEGLWLEDGRCLGILFKGKKIAADATIVATGGLSLPKTGSTGDGYRMAKAAGVKVMPQAPSLVGYQADLKGCDLQGLTLRHVVVTSPKRKSFEGPLLFTHQ
ncbi:MAG: aminoacetone oxidase family FAD-binding enzyme, partial [bacterium]